MIYSNYDRMNIENAFDKYLYDGIDEDGWIDDEYSFEEEYDDDEEF